MFKVQENGDGSTSIFCNSTGALICTIRSQHRNMGQGCRPVNVIEPSTQPRSHSYNLDIKSDCSSDEDPKKFRKKSAYISPLPDEPKEDFYDNCITPEEFARCLNLVPTKQFQETPLDQINSTFPLRHHSRTKLIHDNLHDFKIADNLPLSSSYGVKLLKLNPQKHFYSNQTLEQKIKNYDSFCHTNVVTPTVCSSFPKLRCREKKDYSIYGSHKFYRSGPTHMYAFNKKQRLEKMITFQTGLSTRSRRLLLKCKNRIAVRLKKLTSDEIQVWLSKRSSIVRPITFDCIQDEAIVLGSDSETMVLDKYSVPCSISDSNIFDSSSSSASSSSDDSEYLPVNHSLHSKVVNFKGVLNKPGKCLSNKSDKYLSPTKSNKFLSSGKSVNCLSVSAGISRQNNRIYKPGSMDYQDCCVQMSNVLGRICKYLGEYYVRGTPIRIPFFSDYLNSLHPQAYVLNFILDVDAHMNSPSKVLNPRLKSSSHHDHAYHLPQSPQTHKNEVLPNCLNHHNLKATKELLKESNKVVSKPKVLSKLSSMKKSLKMPANANNIPLVDLTQDSPPKKRKKLIFKCHGCGFDKVFYDEIRVKKYGVNHLVKFHSVTVPESFLSVCHNDSYEVIMEAFPGYKRN